MRTPAIKQSYDILGSYWRIIVCDSVCENIHEQNLLQPITATCGKRVFTSSYWRQLSRTVLTDFKMSKSVV